MRETKTNKGITLIALIITIVLNRWRGGRNGRNIVKVNNRVETLEKIENLL